MGSPLRVATYNPLSMLQAGQQDDVLVQFLLAVVGTCWDNHRLARRPSIVSAEVIEALALISTGN